MNSLVPHIGVAEKPARLGGDTRSLPVRPGRILRQNLRRECLGPRDLRATLRHHGVVSVRDIRYAFLAEDGPVSAIAGRARGE